MNPSHNLASTPAASSLVDETPLGEAGFTNLVSRNITIAGHRTSVRLEPDMWTALKEISRRERANMHEVCTTVAQHKRVGSSLTAAIRVFIMAYFRAAATDDGHKQAGHGNGAANGVNVTMRPPVTAPVVPAQVQNSYQSKPAGQASLQTSNLRDGLRNVRPMGRW